MVPKRVMAIFLVGLFVGGIMPFVSADVFVVDPVVIKAKPNETIDIGTVSPGQVVELIINTDSGYGKDAPWQQAILGSQGLSGGIKVENSTIGEKSLISYIRTTPSTPEGTYSIALTLNGEEGLLNPENYAIVLHVGRNLVNASLSAREIVGGVHQPIAFDVLLVNDSSAHVPVRVEPILPSTWATSQELILKPHTFETIRVPVTPRFAGEKEILFKIIQSDNGTLISNLEGKIVAEPTIKDRYEAGLYGFPFFTASLLAQYLVNAFFSQLL